MKGRDATAGLLCTSAARAGLRAHRPTESVERAHAEQPLLRFHTCLRAPGPSRSSSLPRSSQASSASFTATGSASQGHQNCTQREPLAGQTCPPLRSQGRSHWIARCLSRQLPIQSAVHRPRDWHRCCDGRPPARRRRPSGGRQAAGGPGAGEAERAHKAVAGSRAPVCPHLEVFARHDQRGLLGAARGHLGQYDTVAIQRRAPPLLESRLPAGHAVASCATGRLPLVSIENPACQLGRETSVSCHKRCCQDVGKAARSAPVRAPTCSSCLAACRQPVPCSVGRAPSIPLAAATCCPSAGTQGEGRAR